MNLKTGDISKSFITFTGIDIIGSDKFRYVTFDMLMAYEKERGRVRVSGPCPEKRGNTSLIMAGRKV